MNFDSYIWYVSCNVVDLNCFVMCGCMYVGGGGVLTIV
jgi:hypothetical protein